MKTEWQQVKRGDVLPWLAGLHATLNRKGEIVINRTAYERMGTPAAVNLLYDRVNNRIGLQPTSPHMRDAYPLSRSSRHGAQKIRAYRLLTEFGIDVAETLEFPTARFDDDGVLILDLRAARVSRRYIAKLGGMRRLNQETKETQPSTA